MQARVKAMAARKLVVAELIVINKLSYLLTCHIKASLIASQYSNAFSPS